MKHLLIYLLFIPFTTTFVPAANIDETLWYDDIVNFLFQEHEEQGFDSFVIALTRDNNVLRMAYANATDDNPVDEHTRFDAPGLTPAITSLLTARLVDKGLFDWNAQALSLNRKFRIGSAQSKATIRQLINMSAGIPAHTDQMAEDDWYKPQDVFTILKQTIPNSDPGEFFEPADLSTSAAAYLVAPMAGHQPDEPGENYLNTLYHEILAPLGMKHTTIRKELALAPARGLHSSVHDLAQWMMAEAGSPSSSQTSPPFLSPVSKSIRMGTADIRGGRNYAMGWNTHYYLNTRILAAGNSSERSSLLAGYLPEYHVGFVLWVQGTPKQTESTIKEIPLAITELVRTTPIQLEKEPPRPER